MKTSTMNFGGKELIVEDIMNGMNRDVLNSLSLEQLVVIRGAIEQISPMKKHSIDVHFTLPLLFKRLYFVFSSGTDRRENKKVVEKIIDQRVRTQTADALILFTGVFCFSAFMGTIIYKVIQALYSRI